MSTIVNLFFLLVLTVDCLAMIVLALFTTSFIASTIFVLKYVLVLASYVIIIYKYNIV